MTVLLWFTADLRVEDNAALALARTLGPVLPLYVADADRILSGRQWQFVAESLAGLREDLAALGAPLVVRAGRSLPVLERMALQHRCRHLVHRSPATAGLADLAARLGLEVHRTDDAALPAPLPFARVPGVEPGPIPTARGLGLAPDPCPHRQAGGRTRALSTLETHLGRRPAGPSPLFARAERAASRLSPYLAQGVLSAAEVAAAVRAAQAGAPPDRRPGRGLLQGLGRRAVLLRAAAEAVPPPGPAPTGRLGAWRAGETGLPFVDACLRYLAATGWLPDRARALVLAVAVHHLGLDWREAAAHLGAMSTDHDPRLLGPLARGSAPGAGGRRPRIPDPVAEGLAMDPAGAMIRAWVPELRRLPDGGALHRPWRWDGARSFLGRHYPEPLVDPVAATRAARSGDSARQLDLGLAGRP